MKKDAVIGNSKRIKKFNTGRIHELKIWPEYFEGVATGVKKFEYRLNDRYYRVGDILYLREYIKEAGIYSGREIKVLVTYILKVENNYVIMSINKIGNNRRGFKEVKE